MQKSYLEASIWAADEIEKVVVDGKLDFPETSFSWLALLWCDGVSRIPLKDGKESYYYKVSLKLGLDLTRIAKLDYQMLGTCMDLCALNVMHGKAIPEGFRPLVAGVLFGEITRSKPPHRPRGSNFLEHMFLYNVVKHVECNFRLKVSRNDESNRDSACDVVVGALKVCEVARRYSFIKNLMQHEDYQRTRKEIEAANKIWTLCKGKERLSGARGLGKALHPRLQDKSQIGAKLDDETVKEILDTLPVEKIESYARISQGKK